MRILLVAPYFRDSFAGKISMGSAVMAAEQLSRRHQVLVVTTGRDKAVEKVSDSLTVLSARGWLLPDPINYVVSPACLLLARRNIREFDPHLVMVNKFMFFTSLAAPIAKLMGKPTVIVTDTYPGLNWFPRNRLVAAVMRLYARLVGLPLLRSVDKVVLLHEGLEDIARRHRINYCVIHNGKDLAQADAAPPASDLVKLPGEIWIAYVGRLESVKGYDLLLRAAKNLRARYPQVKTFFIGASRPEHLSSSPEVQFLGFRRDVYSILKRMDIFCLPSLSEGLPNALMEAMAVGCACVASRVGGVVCLVEDEKEGLLVPPRDAAALEQALARLVESPELRAGLASEARKKIQGQFNWDRIARQYQALFEQLLGHPVGEWEEGESSRAVLVSSRGLKEGS